MFVSVADVIDVKAEKARLTREMNKVRGYASGLEKKLANEKFVANAPENIVAAERVKFRDAKATLVKLNEAMARLDAM